MSTSLYRKASGITLASVPVNTGASADKQKSQRADGADVKRSSAGQRSEGTGSGKKKTAKKTGKTAKTTARATNSKSAAAEASRKTAARRAAKKK